MANTREFSGKDVKINWLQSPVSAVSIKYSAKQDKKNTYVLGKKEPHSKVVGRKEFEGAIVLPQSELERLQLSLPAETDPLDIANSSIVVLYLDESTGLFTSDILRDVEVMEFEKSMSQDDEMMEVTMKLNIGSIIYGVK